MRARWIALALLLAGVGLYATVAVPMQRQASAAADEYRRARDEARDIRTRLARLERRDAIHARAAQALAAAATPGAAVRAVRRSVVQTLQGAHVTGVRLSVVPARAPYTTRVRLTAVGHYADAVALSGLVARPETAIVLEHVHLTPHPDGVSIDIEGVTIGSAP